MSCIPDDLRRLVETRAGGRCEYCRLHQYGQEATFHIDHLSPVSRGGPASEGNLALACVSCSLRKAARVEAVDPDTGKTAPIYHPRIDRWSMHFAMRGAVVQGLTDIGRATVAALDMNRPLAVAIRREQQTAGFQ